MTPSGWTSVIGPNESATTWSSAETPSATIPATHSGRWARRQSSRGSAIPRSAAREASICWSAAASPKKNAPSSAATTETVTTGQPNRRSSRTRGRRRSLDVVIGRP